MTLAIRPLAADDVDAIADLARHTWQDAYADLIPQAQIDYMLAQRYNRQTLLNELDRVGIWWDQLFIGDERAAFASYHLTGQPGEMKLDKLYVTPEHQREGLGGILLTHVSDQAREQGCSHLILAVNKRNERAINAYKKHGFSVREAVQVDIGSGFVMDDFIMEKSVL